MAPRSEVFVDTGVWYAAIVTNSVSHAACEACLVEASDRLLTTDYVIDELVTLLVARGNREAAIEYVPRLLGEGLCRLHRIDESDFAAAWRLVERFADKRWSFTDCTSYAVMQRLGVTEALSLDDHFHQFGLCDVRP